MRIYFSIKLNFNCPFHFVQIYDTQVISVAQFISALCHFSLKLYIEFTLNSFDRNN